MKKLCAKQNWRAKQWEFSQSVRKLFAMCCEFRNAKNHSEFRNAKFRNAKNHMKISQCEKPQRISQCEISQCENHIVNFAMRKENFAMPNGCQLFAKIHVLLFFFFFFFFDFQYMLQNLHKTSKIKTIKIA